MITEEEDMDKFKNKKQRMVHGLVLMKETTNQANKNEHKCFEEVKFHFKVTHSWIYFVNLISQPTAIKLKEALVLIWTPSRTLSETERVKSGQPHQPQGE